jgi:hypothetical protein
MKLIDKYGRAQWTEIIIVIDYPLHEELSTDLNLEFLPGRHLPRQSLLLPTAAAERSDNDQLS